MAVTSAQHVISVFQMFRAGFSVPTRKTDVQLAYAAVPGLHEAHVAACRRIYGPVFVLRGFKLVVDDREVAG